MRGTPDKTLTPQGALRLEAFIIGLGMLALVLIFQPSTPTKPGPFSILKNWGLIRASHRTW